MPYQVQFGLVPKVLVYSCVDAMTDLNSLSLGVLDDSRVEASNLNDFATRHDQVHERRNHLATTLRLRLHSMEGRVQDVVGGMIEGLQSSWMVFEPIVSGMPDRREYHSPSPVVGEPQTVSSGIEDMNFDESAVQATYSNTLFLAYAHMASERQVRLLQYLQIWCRIAQNRWHMYRYLMARVEVDEEKQLPSSLDLFVGN